MKQLILTTPLELLASSLALVNNTSGGNDITLDEADLLLHQLFSGSPADADFAQAYATVRDVFQRVKGASEAAERLGAKEAVFDTHDGTFTVGGFDATADVLKRATETLKEARDELDKMRILRAEDAARISKLKSDNRRLSIANNILRGAPQAERVNAEAENVAKEMSKGKSPVEVANDQEEGVAEAILSALRGMGHTGPVEIRRIVL